MVGFGRGNGGDEAAEAMAQYREEAWAYALARDELPEFVENRLKAAAERKSPWLSTMSPAELLLAKSHGMRPLATISGTCWFHHGYSWTDGHVDGWGAAVKRLKREALAVGANAVVDVQMRTVQSPSTDSKDFTVFGTAVCFDRLPPSTDPAVATVSALDFVRFLEMGISVCGIAIGADYQYLSGGWGGMGTASYAVGQQLRALGGNVHIEQLSDLWQEVRRNSHAQLRRNAAKSGNGVLANVQFGELQKVEIQNQGTDYLARQIVIGTVVDTLRAHAIPYEITSVVDMRDDLSPLGSGGDRIDLNANNEHTGGI